MSAVPRSKATVIENSSDEFIQLLPLLLLPLLAELEPVLAVPLPRLYTQQESQEDVRMQDENQRSSCCRRIWCGEGRGVMGGGR
jgi:hypothetical protein